MPDSINKFSGAWLTDIDDTLIPSGVRPDDEWIASLAVFIRHLKSHNIVWAPVSGVAINMMGPRLLFRLPDDVLSHVIYYGGEGGIKSYYHFDTAKWYSPEYFQKNFTDAQALVLVGEQRFREALITHYCIDIGGMDKLEHSHHETIQQRISSANAILQKTRYSKISNLVDQMQSELKRAGFDVNKAETYYRGGAISWLMFGDTSVKFYQGEHETQTRDKINSFIKNKLSAIDNIADIGNNGIHMPYLHATRGIKLILMGNDKGRAADDLIKIEGIAADRLLFVGNELFDGGNDNSVRRVKGINILSVGETEDPGVIDGGVQVTANQYWMDTFTKKLDQGVPWPNVLSALPDDALVISVRQKINTEKEYAHKVSDWHLRMSEQISTDLLLQLYRRYAPVFRQTRECLLSVKNTQYQLVTKLAALEKYHYDKARKIVKELIGDHPSESEKDDIKQKIKHYLILEITGLLKVLLVDHLNCSEKLVRSEFDKVDNLTTLRLVTRRLIETSDVAEPALELERKNELIVSWNTHIDELVDTYFEGLTAWKKNLVKQAELIAIDESVVSASLDCSADELCEYIRWLISRVDKYPHLKDLDKPTIILVAGTTGVGKSTISRHVSKTLGIPTAFSSDVASRAVVRETIAFLLGKERAEQLFPEVIGSSFQENSPEWFYAHSLMTMVGVTGNINRLIKENISAVIDGVALIPGTLPETLFEKANIVWVVASVADRDTHFKRLGTRSETGLERGGADRYRNQFSAIRSNQARLIKMALKTDTLLVDNGDSMNAVFISILERVNNPIADRGLSVDDAIRDKVKSRLQERSTWDIQNILKPED